MLRDDAALAGAVRAVQEPGKQQAARRWRPEEWWCIGRMPSRCRVTRQRSNDGFQDTICPSTRQVSSPVSPTKCATLAWTRATGYPKLPHHPVTHL